MRKPSLNSSHPSISLTSLKGKIHFSGQHKYISAQGTNTFKQARKYIHLTANKFFGHLQIYNSIAQAPLNDDWQFFHLLQIYPVLQRLKYFKLVIFGSLYSLNCNLNKKCTYLHTIACSIRHDWALIKCTGHYVSSPLLQRIV